MKSSKSLIRIIIVLVLIVLGFLVVHYFLYRDIKNKNENISKIKYDLSVKESRQDYLVSTQKLIDSLDSDIQSVNNSIVASGGDVEFIESLESVAKSNGLSIDIENLAFGENAAYKQANVAEFKIKASTSGSWAGTYAFLNQLESLPVKVKINSFSIISVPQDDNADKKTVKKWKGNFDIVVLKYK